MAHKHYRVGEVARLAGITVRTLHHYDEIGLLRPAGRSSSGYRLYDDDDLLRLQQIFIGRQLGLSLDEIGRALDDPSHDHRAALERQRRELRARQNETTAMLAAIDAALRVLDREATKGDEPMDPRTLFDGLDGAALEEEAKRRWGDTDAYRESARRTSSYGPQQWAEIRGEEQEILEALVRAMESGTPADGKQARSLAERHRLHIDRWFYPCAHAMHVGLSDMYLADERFAAHFDRHATGLAAYLVRAIRANAAAG